MHLFSGFCYYLRLSLTHEERTKKKKKIEEKARVQTFKKIETNLNCSFLKIASLTDFSISFLLFIMFDIMLERYICLTRSNNFVFY